MFSQSSFITDYNLFATINLGLLAIMAIVFGLTSIRKDIEDDFNKEIENINKEDLKKRDVLLTKIHEEIKNLKKTISNAGSWFRKGIYFNLFALLIILINPFYKSFVFDTFVLIILIFSLIIVSINIHSLKKIMDLDAECIVDGFREKIKSIEDVDFKKIFETMLNQKLVTS